jgi:hypothetical protein
MANDIFSGGISSTVAGGLRLNGYAVMAFDANGAAVIGTLVQNYNIAYQQQLTKLRALNTNSAFVVVAPPNGQCTIASAISGGKEYVQFIKKYSDACTVSNNMLHFKALTTVCATKNWNSPDLTLKGCLISQIQLSQNIQDLVLNSNVQLEFIALESA